MSEHSAENDAAGIDPDHLNGFDCGRCGHSGMAHFRAPSCRACRCSADPVCWCGRLASKHGTSVIPPGKQP